MRHATILVAILAFVPLASATAQEPPPVKVGDRVRVTAPDLGLWKQAGRLEALRADTLVVAVADSTMTFPVASVWRLDVSQGQKSSTLEGAVLGLLAGGVLGVLAEISAGYEKGKKTCSVFIGDIIVDTGPPSEISCREEPATWGSPSWRGATIGAVLGAIAGGLIGARSMSDRWHMSDRWQKIPLEQVRVRVTKRRDGRFALGASVRF